MEQLYRRVIAIDNGDGPAIFRTIRIETDATDDRQIVNEFIALVIVFKQKYQTMIKFVRPSIIPGNYFPHKAFEGVWRWM